MTRFARAKGSKASNERREEEATPWVVMRQQLAEQLSNYQRQSGDNTSYNLKEILNKKNDSSKVEIWSDFGEARSSINDKLRLKTGKTLNKNEKNQKIKSIKNKESDVALSTDSVGLNPISDGKLSGKLKKPSTNIKIVKDDNSIEKPFETFSVSPKKRKAKKVDVEFKVKPRIKKFKADRKNKREDEKCCASKKNKSERLHGKNLFIETPIESIVNNVKFKYSKENSETSLGSEEHVNPPTAKKKMKKKNDMVAESVVKLDEFPSLNKNTTIPKIKQTNSSAEDRKFSKFADWPTPNQSTSKVRAQNNSDYYGAASNHHRKNNFQTIIANGREIQIVKYQAFFIKKDDAEELKKLRKKLLAQNIPKEQLDNIMKLERRKAEKALAREKKKVCYHCRQFGHNFSDCPDIKESDMMKTGVCFKCGSLEHSHFECKVLQHQEFRHAICFVCREQGHIARQCPLNSQGLYPKGGSCHLCGEITHLRKDCPKAVEEKTSKSVTVDTLTNTAVEDFGGQPLHSKEADTKTKKVIKFK